MYKAVPVIAVSAAGLTWLLHAQGAIDSTPSKTTGDQQAGPASSTTTPTSRLTTTTTTRPFGGDDDEAPPPTRASSTTTTAPATSTTASSGSGQRRVDGPTVDTRYGPVQVEVVVNGKKIVDVSARQYPSDARRSQAINAQALPLLKQEVLDAQNANIDGVSGATYTSDGYQQSLQAALDQVGIR